MTNPDNELANTTTINGSSRYYLGVGSGPAVLIMHGGLGLSHNYLRPYFDELAEHNKVGYYNFFGKGQSVQYDEYGEMDFARLTSDAAALRTQLGHENFTLIGHSYGGFSAQTFAAENGNRFNGLILINTVSAFIHEF